MAITGTGTQVDPFLVHDYDEIKSAYGTAANDTVYIRLENDINCNDYGDTWEWGTITSNYNYPFIFDLNGHTIKNIMIKSGNALFEGKTNSSIIHNGKILNVFNNAGASVINGNGLTLKDISMSVNGNGLTSYGFNNVFFENCAVYYKSSKLNAKAIIYSGSAFFGVDGIGAKNCDFYFDVNNMNNKNLTTSVNTVNYDNCRFRGSVSGASNSHYLLGMGKCINSIVDIDTINMTWGEMTGSLKAPCKQTSTGAINTEISPNMVGGTSGLTACTTAQMRDADYLNSIGFTVVKVGE